MEGTHEFFVMEVEKFGTQGRLTRNKVGWLLYSFLFIDHGGRGLIFLRRSKQRWSWTLFKLIFALKSFIYQNKKRTFFFSTLLQHYSFLFVSRPLPLCLTLYTPLKRKWRPRFVYQEKKYKEKWIRIIGSKRFLLSFLSGWVGAKVPQAMPMATASLITG